MRLVTLCSALVLLLACCPPCAAQPPDTLWTRLYGGDSTEAATAICGTPDGGFLLTGYSNSPPAIGFDIFLLRLTGNGDTLWIRLIGGTGNDIGRSIKRLPDGGFILLATSTSFGHFSNDIWLLRLTSIGDTVWTRWYGGSGYDDATDIQLLSDNGFIIAGYSALPGSPTDGYALRTDAYGAVIWSRRYGDTGEQRFQSVEVLPDNGFIFSGYSTISGSNGMDMYVVRTDSQGDTLWTELIGTEGIQDQAVGAQSMADGGYLIAGFTQATTNGQADFAAVSLSSSGATRWIRTYGGNDWDRAYALGRVGDGQFLLGGITDSFGAGNYDCWMVTIDSAGDTLWTDTRGGPENDYLYALVTLEDGGFVAAGYTTYFPNSASDCYAIRYQGYSGVGGVIRDETSQEPLTNIQVSAIGFSHTVLSDALGNYVLTLPANASFDIITFNPCNERDTVWNVSIIEDSIIEVNFNLNAPEGRLQRTSLSMIVPNHSTATDSLWIQNNGLGVLEFNLSAEAMNPDGEWLTATPLSGIVLPGDSAAILVAVSADTTDNGVFDYYGSLTVRMNSCPDSAMQVIIVASILDADGAGPPLPVNISFSAFPNPFNSMITLSFTLPHPDVVSITVINALGQEVQRMLHVPMAAGIHRIPFDASDLSSGIYFARLQTSGVQLTKKLLLMK